MYYFCRFNVVASARLTGLDHTVMYHQSLERGLYRPAACRKVQQTVQMRPEPSAVSMLTHCDYAHHVEVRWCIED